jgi:4-aminobutyrate aminotransferase-like enzyme
VGVELASPQLASRVVEGLRERRILIGRTGRREDVLKIRPPLPFAREHAELLVDEFRHVLDASRP